MIYVFLGTQTNVNNHVSLFKEYNMTTTLETALFLALVGIVGIFIFMSIFFLMIKGLEKWFPYKDGKQNDNDEIGELDGE